MSWILATPASVIDGSKPLYSTVEPTIASSPRRTTYPSLLNTMAVGSPAGQSNASACPRTGSTDSGRGSPAILPDQQPAATSTAPAERGPADVTTPVTRSFSLGTDSTRCPWVTLAPQRAALNR